MNSAEIDERVNSLDGTLSMMSNLEGDHNTTYTLSHVNKNGSVSLIKNGDKKGMISINFSSTVSFVHEVTHAGQYYTNDIGFFCNGSIAAYDIYDEVKAYQAGLAYSSSAYDNTYMSMWEVTPEWVRSRGNNYKDCGRCPVNINSSAEIIKKSGLTNLSIYQTYLDIPPELLIYRH